MAKRKSTRTLKRKKNKISTTIKNEIIGILIIGLSCLGFVLLFSENNSLVATYGVEFLRIIAGDGSVGIFIVLAAVGISLMGKNKEMLTSRMMGIIILLFAAVGFLHLNVIDATTNSGEIFKAGWDGKGGGLFGAAITYFFLNAVGKTGSYILLVVLAIIGSVLFFNRSLVTTILEILSWLKRLITELLNSVNDFIKVLSQTGKDQTSKTAKGNSKAANSLREARKKRSERESADFIFEAESENELVIVDNYENNIPIDPSDKKQKNGESFNPRQKSIFVEEAEQPNMNQSPFADIGKITSTPISRQSESSKDFRLPPLTLVNKSLRVKNQRLNKGLADSVKILEETLASFGVKVKVTRVSQGPTITRYEVQPAPGVKVSKITGLADDIALSLAASDVRMEAPIPGKSAVGIEVPNKEIAIVHFREVLETEEFQSSPSKLSLALGKDISGTPIIGDLTRMPHMLIAGATGAGKSVCINTIIASIVYKAKPDEVKLLLIDPKKVELTNYNGIPHLISPVVTEPQKAAGALKWIVTEMESRYELFASSGVRDIVRYNYIQGEKNEETAKPLPYVVVIIDELSDLMMVAPGDVEELICRLAQMARAAGIHLIVATQRPSVDVITGLIKANIPSRIAFAVSSQTDSRTILDTGGAEKLLGRGDMLYHPIGTNKPLRVQGCFLSDKEVKNIVDYLKKQGQPEYHEIPETNLERKNGEEPEDELFYKAALLFYENNTASVSLLQRRLRVGYTRAARLMDILEDKGVVGPYEGSKPREIVMSRGQFEQRYGTNEDS